MDLTSNGEFINQIESRLTNTIPRIDDTSKRKSGQVRPNKSCGLVDSAVGIQLATDSDTVTVSRKRKKGSEKFIISEGATYDVL